MFISVLQELSISELLCVMITRISDPIASSHRCLHVHTLEFHR